MPERKKLAGVISGKLCLSYLDQVLAFWFGDEGLEFGSGEGVDQASLRDD